MELRICDSCRFFQQNASSSLGICTHPDHQAKGVTPLVRAAELRCRRSFGQDDWSPMIGAHIIHLEDVLISERPAPLDRPWSALPAPHHEPPAQEHPSE